MYLIMEEKRVKEIKVRVSEEEYAALQRLSEGTPVAVYMRERGLSAALPVENKVADSFASVLAGEGGIILERVAGRFGTLEEFMNTLLLKVGALGDNQLFDWVLNRTAPHPFAGHTIVDISRDGVTIAKDGRHLAISEELGNGGMLRWFFDEQGEAKYQVGDVVGQV